jgi:hypothetical protein
MKLTTGDSRPVDQKLILAAALLVASGVGVGIPLAVGVGTGTTEIIAVAALVVAIVALLKD